ncbi:MAG: M24 family metallopeptidase [Spirochaetaceae bacterium]|nr:M24 family metallopeptidase [Spirochaetaceae bacterium]
MEFAEAYLYPGISTLELAEILEKSLMSRAVDPGVIIGISPEETAWHGIPGKRKLKTGELVTIDIACSVRGWWADAARTFPIGSVDAKRENLMLSAWMATKEIVSIIREKQKGIEVSRYISNLTRERGVSLIREGAGHGIGRRIHELPSLTYDGRTHAPFQADFLYTAEPVFSAGNGEILISTDGSAVSADSEPTAHFEVTMLLLKHGAHILGAPDWINHPPC